MKAIIAAALTLLAGCSSLYEIGQGSIDQYAARQDSTPEVVAVFVLPPAGLGTAKLAESLQDIGRAVARQVRPFAQIELTVANANEARFALEQIEKGIRGTGWTPEALIYPHRVIIDPTAHPLVRVIDGLPALSNYDRELIIEASRQAQLL